MDPLSTTASILGLGKTAVDMTLGLAKLQTNIEVAAKSAELLNVILALQQAGLESQVAAGSFAQKTKELEDEIVRLKEVHGDLSRYVLLEPWRGTLVYAVRATASGGEPAHYACTNCYTTPKKSILQQKQTPQGWTVMSCPSCKTEFPTHLQGSVAAVYA